MNQRAITPYLARKGLSAVEIHTDLAATLGPESVNYLSLTCYLRQAKFATWKPSIVFSEPEPQPDGSDVAVLLVLSEQSFALV
jgi:hypothetical protein